MSSLKAAVQDILYSPGIQPILIGIPEIIDTQSCPSVFEGLDESKLSCNYFQLSGE